MKRRCRCRSGWTALFSVIKKDGKRESKESVDWTGLDWTGLDGDNTGDLQLRFWACSRRGKQTGGKAEVGKFLYLGWLWIEQATQSGRVCSDVLFLFLNFAG